MNDSEYKLRNEDDSLVQCSCCDDTLLPTGNDEWFSPDGDSILLPVYDEPYAEIELNRKILIVCEKCYKSKKYGFDDIITFQIHEDFSNSYTSLKKYVESIECCLLALKIKQDVDIMDRLGYNYSNVGLIEKARESYLEALKIDPKDFIATENLKNLDERFNS